LSALEAAHERGVIHRDLKPENVFLNERGGVTVAKLLDFGVSKSLTEHTHSITMTGVVVGTPYYLSPEQARGERHLDHRVDLWAMGVLMYEALTGVLPYTAKTYEELLDKILHGAPVPPSRYQPRLAPAVEAIVTRAMAPRPEDRFASASAMLAAVDGARRARARFPAFDLDGAGDVTVRTRGEPGPDDPTEVSDSFVGAELPIVAE